MNASRMKTNLRRTSAILLIAAIAFWIYAGANPGWTRTAVPVKTLDKVTGIEGVSWQKQFVPGVDFLMVAAPRGQIGYFVGRM